MHQYLDIFMGVFCFALGVALIRAAQVGSNQDKKIARLERENDCLADANAAMFLAFVEDTFEKAKLRRENSAMWNFIRKDTALPADMLADEPIPFVPSDELVKHWEKEAQPPLPFLFEDNSFKDGQLQPHDETCRHEQAVDLVKQEMGGTVLTHDRFTGTPDCEQ